MYYKISPIMISILILVIIAVVGFGMAIVHNYSTKGNSNDQSSSNVSEIVPELELSTDTEEENQESVTIKAVARTEDETGINCITLPDGSSVYETETEYKVTENGNYTFKVKGNNEQTSSRTIEIKNIREASASSPYIPEGFNHVEGDPENGYVIEDYYGNQFVWVPVESGKMTRNTMLEADYEESNSTASALVNSVAQNYGFYMGRYEASSVNVNGSVAAGSIAGKTPWTNVSYTEAATAASDSAKVFGYEGYQTAILNSYAWDTTLAWIDQTTENYSSNTSYGNYSGQVRNTGETQTDMKNNLCDIAGNVREWTTEIYKNSAQTQNTNTSKKNSKNNKNVENEEVVSETVNYRVIRGGSANLNRTASSHTGYKENMSDGYWGFRVILYK